MSIGIDYSGKVVVVVGGTSGINRAIAELFAQQGCKVAVASRSVDKVNDTISALQSAGAQAAIGKDFDVRNPDDVVNALGDFHEQLGDFDVLISGAAGNFLALMSEMSVNAFKTVVDIDLLGTANVMKAAYPFMKRPGSSIINISAPQAALPYEAQAHVCAAKAGVDQITRTLALEWGPEGIRINSVVPGMIDETEGMKRLTTSQRELDLVVSHTPLQRLGAKRDIANMCLLLSSDLASFVTGQVIDVDGGIYLRGSSLMGKAFGDMQRNKKS